MVLVLITCRDKKEAEKIGLVLLKKKMAACMVVIPKVSSAYLWSSKTGRIEKANEAILLLKALSRKFADIEQEVKKLHSYNIPFMAAVQVSKVNQEYLKWLQAELN